MLGAGVALAREQLGGSRGGAVTICVALKENLPMVVWTSLVHKLALKSLRYGRKCIRRL